MVYREIAPCPRLIAISGCLLVSVEEAKGDHGRRQNVSTHFTVTSVSSGPGYWPGVELKRLVLVDIKYNTESGVDIPKHAGMFTFR